MKRYYLAYGSNLNINQMRFRCPTARLIGTAVIKDYGLLFRGSKTGSYLTIEPKQGASVPVAVWTIEKEDEDALDRYEGYPGFYKKTELPVELEEGTQTAMVYVMNDEAKGKFRLPAEYYYYEI